MHQNSAPTFEYGAPPLPVTPPPARGRCANCVQPITPDQPAERVITPKSREFPNTPTPWRHKLCPGPCRHHTVNETCTVCVG
jgi:hypothetical protein